MYQYIHYLKQIKSKMNVSLNILITHIMLSYLHLSLWTFVSVDLKEKGTEYFTRYCFVIIR